MVIIMEVMFVRNGHMCIFIGLSDFLNDVNDWIRDRLSLIIISAEQRWFKQTPTLSSCKR